jgi:hypothetical protein
MGYPPARLRAGKMIEVVLTAKKNTIALKPLSTYKLT